MDLFQRGGNNGVRRQYHKERLSHNFELCLQELGPHLYKGQTKYAVTAETKLLVTLRFLAQGSYQLNVANELFSPVSKAKFSNILHEVIHAMNVVFCPRYIQFSPPTAMDITMNSVLHLHGIPGVAGFVDGTQILIVPLCRPYTEHIYVDKKHRHAINTQIVCNHQYRILNINAKFT